MTSIVNYLVTHLGLLLTIYLAVGIVALVGYAAVPLRKRFPRFAGIIEVCRSLGPDLKKLTDGLSLILFGKVPPSLLDAIVLLIQRWCTTAMLLVTAVFLLTTGAGGGIGCSAQQLDGVQQACPVIDRSMNHVQLAISLAKTACTLSPLEIVTKCNLVVNQAVAAAEGAEEGREKACKVWPYLLTAQQLVKYDKLDAAVTLGDTLLQCKAVP